VREKERNKKESVEWMDKDGWMDGWMIHTVG
jgi:hypothetical protein